MAIPTPDLIGEQVAPTAPGIMLAGAYFPYGHRANWSLKERATWNARWERITALEARAEPTDEESAEYGLVLTEIMRMILPTMTPEELAVLSTDDRIVVTQHFLTTFPNVSARVVASLAAKTVQIGGESSPASHAPTRASLPKDG